jgi:hypothetical protein
LPARTGPGYRYYVCYRSQQKLEGYCASRAVSAPSVEDAVVETIRRVGVQPDVLAETARLARQQLAEIITGLRGELNTTNGRVKNLKSQIARIRNPEAARSAEIREQRVLSVSLREPCLSQLSRLSRSLPPELERNAKTPNGGEADPQQAIQDLAGERRGVPDITYFQIGNQRKRLGPVGARVAANTGFPMPLVRCFK